MFIFLPEWSPTPVQEIDELRVFCLNEELPRSKSNSEYLVLLLFFLKLTNLSSRVLELKPLLVREKFVLIVKLHERNKLS